MMDFVFLTTMTVMSVKMFLNFVHCYFTLSLLFKYPSLIKRPVRDAYLFSPKFD